MGKGLLAIALIGLSGCGTIASHQLAGPRIYGGVRFDGQAVWERPPLLILFPLDLPFSLAFDTLSLPWTITHTATTGEQPLETIFGEPTKPHAIVEGIIVRGAASGYEVVAIQEWPPKGLEPVVGGHVQIYANPKEAPLAVEGKTRSDERGRYELFSGWEPAWKHLRFEGEGFEPLEIPVSRLHDPTDQHYWGDHRLLIRLAPR
jgi:uncharacterized protein YceK